MKNSTRGLLMVIISGIVFGAMPSAVTYCYTQGVTKLLAMLARYLILGLVMLPSALRAKNTFALYRRYWWKTLIISATGLATALLLYSAYNLLPTGVVTTIHFLYPSFVALLCFLVFREKLSRLNLVCLALSVSGILLMFDAGGEALNIPGLILTLLSSVAWAVYIILLDKLPLGEITSEQLLFYGSCNGALLTLTFGLVSGSFAGLTVTPVGWLALVGTSFLIQFFGSRFFTLGVRQTNAQVSAIASTLEPITSLLIGAAFLHEPLTLRTGLGAALILLAVVLLAVFENKPKKKEKTA